MTKNSDVDRIKNMCEIALIRAAEGGESIDFEDLHFQIAAQIGNLPTDEGLLLSKDEISIAIQEALEEFEDSYFLDMPYEQGYDF